MRVRVREVRHHRGMLVIPALRGVRHAVAAHAPRGARHGEHVRVHVAPAVLAQAQQRAAALRARTRAAGYG